MNQLDQVHGLIGRVDQEAAVSSQHLLKDVHTTVTTIARQMNESKEQQNTSKLSLDEITKIELSTRIGEVTAKYIMNSLYSQFSSIPGIDAGIGGEHSGHGAWLVTNRDKGVLLPRNLAARPSTELEKPKECECSQILPPQSFPLIFRTAVSHTSLFSALKHSPDVPQQDLKRCLSMGKSLIIIDQDRVKWTMQSPKLLKWLISSPKSRTLLINGNGDANEMFSSTTFLSAKMLESLGQIEPILSQHFFCSLHTTSRIDNMADATGLIKSFVCQLLLRDFAWDLTFLSTTDLWKIQNNDLETICALFRKLVQQLRDPTFLFWIIDGINYYERSERRRDFLKVIHELLGVI